MFLSALATSLLAGGIMLAALPAHAATTPGSFDVPDQTVAQGGTVSATLTPTEYTTGGTSTFDYSYYCYDAAPLDANFDESQPGFSSVLVLIPQTGNPVWAPDTLTYVTQDTGSTGSDPWYQLKGAGVGNITPLDSVPGGPSTLTFKLPSDIPAGVYGVAGGCMSPDGWTVKRDGDPTLFGVKFGKITVTAAPTPPQPEEKSASLAKTGATSANSTIYGSVAAVALALGIASVLMRRRSRS